MLLEYDSGIPEGAFVALVASYNSDPCSSGAGAAAADEWHSGPQQGKGLSQTGSGWSQTGSCL